MSTLVTLLGDTVIGSLERGRSGRIAFSYDDDWRSSERAIPLSLSMPLTARDHGHKVVDAFLWGLLPDNQKVLDAWGTQFHVSARNALSLLEHVGEDCAGAVRFTLPDRINALVRGSGKVDWLDEKEMSERLRALRLDGTAWRNPDDTGQFSLAGAQAKTALLFDGKRWGVPSGRTATTHILKPGISGLDGHAENEHFCLVLASELGLPTVTSRIEWFADELAIVVERYDRMRTGERIERIHQEDMCQTLAIHPERKYENEDGPGVRSISELIRDNSRAFEDDIETFMMSLAYGWLIVATDGHAKNYSMLLGEGATARLAPLYDVASALPYHDRELRRLKLAMKIGGKYRVREIGKHEWRKLARELRWEEDRMVERVLDMAKRLPDLASTVAKRLRKEGLEHRIVKDLAERIAARAVACSSTLS